MERLIIPLAILFLFLGCAKKEEETNETNEPVIEVYYNPEGGSYNNEYCNESTKPKWPVFNVEWHEKGGVCSAECTYNVIVTFDNGTEETIYPSGLVPFTLSADSITAHLWGTFFQNGCVSSKLGTYDCKKTGC